MMLRRDGLSCLSALWTVLLLVELCLPVFWQASVPIPVQALIHTSGPVATAFSQAAEEFSVPEALLKAICYMEGRLSNQGGLPSMDGGFGCMHLVKNERSNMLDKAANLLHVGEDQLKVDLTTNIRGGAALLRVDALQLASDHRLPSDLNGWYGAVALYSQATLRSTALMYADAVYTLVRQGFTARADDAEAITLQPQAVHPSLMTAAAVRGLEKEKLPSGCRSDKEVDYPGAIDCILPARVFDCNAVGEKDPCTYESANRPTDLAVDQIVIHDIEGSAYSALNVLQDVHRQSSVQYVIESDGTVYQMVHDKDIAYHDGNYWSNQHSIGIEHAGYDLDGYKWYNATEYLASAKLTAYLLRKYQLPLDHAHILSHGTVPSPSATALPNHVDPGPYWLWSYYFSLVHQQGIPYADPASEGHILRLHPKSALRPAGSGGHEAASNFSFFYLYTSPSTSSGRIPRQNAGSDLSDVTDNLEAESSFYYLEKVRDKAGSGATMYKVWYGVEDEVHSSHSSRMAHARQVWLAVPSASTQPGPGSLVTLQLAQTPTTSQSVARKKATTVQIYGRPMTGESNNLLGDAPVGATFVSGYTVVEDGTTNIWYEINYNHRQAWVPASEVVGAPVQTLPQPTPTPTFPDPLPTPVVQPTPTPGPGLPDPILQPTPTLPLPDPTPGFPWDPSEYPWPW